MIPFWNNLRQVHSQPEIWGSQIIHNSLGATTPKDLNMIAVWSKLKLVLIRIALLEKFQ
jgi:hypothetical protein